MEPVKKEGITFGVRNTARSYEFPKKKLIFLSTPLMENTALEKIHEQQLQNQEALKKFKKKIHF